MAASGNNSGTGGRGDDREKTPGEIAEDRIDLKSLASVSLVGAPDNLTCSQNAGELKIKVPPKAPYDSPAYSFRLTFSGQIPTLNP